MGVLSSTGFPACVVATNQLRSTTVLSLAESIRVALVVLLTYTGLISHLFVVLFSVSSIFSVFVVINALLVKYYGYDLTGQPQSSVPGWAFIIIFMAISFQVILLLIYLLYLSIYSLFRNTREKPGYQILSVRKF